MSTSSVPPSPTTVNQTDVQPQTLLTAYVGAGLVLNALRGPLCASDVDAIKAKSLSALQARGVDPYQPFRASSEPGRLASEGDAFPGQPWPTADTGDDPLADMAPETDNPFDVKEAA